MKLCTISNCGKEIHAKGVCKKHYGALPEIAAKNNKSTKRWLNKNKEAQKIYRYKLARTPQRRFNMSKRHAIKDRNLLWEISFEQYSKLISLPCYYCNKELNQTGCGLDRLNNRLGYITENVVPCCKECNFIKGNLEQAGFVYPRTMSLMQELLIENKLLRYAPNAA